MALPLHPSGYDDLPASALVNVADIAAMTGKARDTAYRWTRKDDFPPPHKVDDDHPENTTWRIGPVVGWLCATERLADRPEYAQVPGGRRGEAMLTRPEVEAIAMDVAGLTRNNREVRIHRGTFPKPAARIGNLPVWRKADVDRWADEQRAAKSEPAGVA